jgi:MFS family permease
LFSVLQIPVAYAVERIGYKRFMVRGWTSRSVFILGIAVAALWPEGPIGPYRIALVLFMLACFAVVRGISMCGYLPWIAGIVPESLRGTFLSRDTMCMHLAITVTMLLSGLWLGLFPSARAFGVVFVFSYAAALAGVFYLRRIPDIHGGVGGRGGGTHLPWKAMLLYPPFARFVVFTVVFNVFVSALSVLWVSFMRDSYRASEGLILSLSAYASIVGALASWAAGVAADRVGSRPLLSFAGGLAIVGQSLWMSMSAGALPHWTPILFAITSFGATGFAVTGVASTRWLMGLVPVLGRSHFFAVSNVAGSLTLGLLPIVWGVALDWAGRIMTEGTPLAPGWTWNPYSVLYAVVVAGLLGAQYFRRRLDEPRAMRTEEFMRILFIHSPARLVARVMQPLRRHLPPG